MIRREAVNDRSHHLSGGDVLPFTPRGGVIARELVGNGEELSPDARYLFSSAESMSLIDTRVESALI